ncbi:MAG: MMPL family transporter [Gammaproteobacteria bacterium]
MEPPPVSQHRSHAAIISRLSAALARWQIRHRLPLLGLFLLITLLLGYHATFLRMEPGFDKSIPANHEYVETYDEYGPVFGGANVVIVALIQKQGNIFNPDFFTRLEQATEDLLLTTGVDRSSTMSLFTPQVNFVAVNEEGFIGYRIVKPDFTATPENIAEVERNLLQSAYLGRLVTRDFRGALVRADLVEWNPITRERLDYTQVAEQLDQIRSRYESDNIDVHIIGFAKLIDNIIDAALGVMQFFLIALVITAVLLYFYSGSLQITGLVLLVSITAVIWQLGLMRLLGFGIDPMSILVVFLILSIAISHAVQMANTWKLELVAGASNREAAQEAFNKLFIPGATALLTLAVGFGVIMLVDIPILYELGITASIGASVMLITNKFMLPGLLSWSRLPPAVLEKLRHRGERIHPLFSFIASFADRRRGSGVLGVAALLLLFGGWKGADLIVGDSQAGAPEFWPDARYNRDIDAIVSNFFFGLDELTVIAEMADDGCVDHATVDRIDQFVWRMGNVEGVQTVRSLTKVMKQRTVGNTEGHPKFYSLPRQNYGLASALRGIELNTKLFNDQCNAMPVRILLADHRAETLIRVTDAVKEFEAEFGRDGLHFRLASGPAGVMAAVNESVRASEWPMKAALFPAVALLTYLTFLSLPGALCVLIPLALVSYLADSVMAIMGIGLKVSTLPVVALGVGVGVDYGIYLFARTQAGLRQGLALKQAYYRALESAGTAVIFTATTLTIGVITWGFSALKFQADMGLLLAYMFFVNMLAALFVLPALAAWLFPRSAVKGAAEPLNSIE